MMETNPNQKVIITSAAPANKENIYAVINIEAMNMALSELSGNTFKIWSYMSRHQNQYKYALSCKDVCDVCGIGKTTYHKGIKELEELGYLVPTKSGSNVYVFNQAKQDSSAVPAHNNILSFGNKNDSNSYDKRIAL